jgi:outer membrane protein
VKERDMRFARRLLAIAMVVAFAPAARAVDLADVWRAAAQSDPEFAAARAAHAAGESRRAQAGALWRPSVMLEGGVARAANETATRGARFSAPGFGQTTGVDFDTSVTSGTSGRVALTVRQPLFNRERDVQASQLRLSAEAADSAWRDAQQALILRSADRYFDVALAAEQLRLIKRQEAAVDQALAEAKDRFRIGDRPVIDVHEASARAAALKAQRLVAENLLDVKRAALAQFSGLDVDGQSFALPAPRSGALDPGPLPGWLSETIEDNPAVRAAQARLRAAQEETRKTSAALSPTVDLVAQVGRDRLSGSGDFGSASNSANNRSIGVQIAVPLYTGGWRSAQQTEALALVDQARAELERTRQQVTLQTRSTWLDLAAGGSQTEALEAASVASQARLDATRVGREAGDRTTLDLLNAENDAAAAELSLLQARVRLFSERLRLAALAGRLDEGRLLQANAELHPAGRSGN